MTVDESGDYSGSGGNCSGQPTFYYARNVLYAAQCGSAVPSQRETTAQTMTSADFGAWNVESLRLTVFHQTTPSPVGLWRTLMDADPINTERRPTEQKVIERGPAFQDTILLETQPQRLDWHQLPGAPPTTVAEGDDLAVAVLSNPTQSWALLERALAVTLDEVAIVPRIALGATLMQVFPDLQQAQARLAHYVPHLSLEVQSGASDLVYQVNRARRSATMHSVRINRLSTWTLTELVNVPLTFNPATGVRLADQQKRDVLQTVLDINNAPMQSDISVKRFPALLTEFIDLAKEIANKGDVR